MENKQTKISLDFQQNEVAVILKALSRMPYGEVFSIINRISSEVNKQLKSETVNPTTKPPKP